MSKKYTLNNIVNEDSIYLIGINSSLDSYKLVFKINKELNLNFVRSKKDIDLPKEKAYYSHFVAKNNSEEILTNELESRKKNLLPPFSRLIANQSSSYRCSISPSI